MKNGIELMQWVVTSSCIASIRHFEWQKVCPVSVVDIPSIARIMGKVAVLFDVLIGTQNNLEFIFIVFLKIQREGHDG